jgi:Ca2+-binding RTX toxin-like protein
MTIEGMTNNIMNKTFFRIILLMVLVSSLVYFNGGLNLFNFSRTAYAVGDLTVDWGSAGVGDVGPVFTVANMAPGESQSHQVTVTNGSTSTRPVGIRAIKNTETGNLSTVLDVVIRRDGTDVYGGSSGTGAKTMANFFSESVLPNFIELSTLTPSETETYTILITFQSSAGNQFQGKTISFNLAIGIDSDVPAACSGITFSGNPIFGTSGNDNLRGTNKNDLIISLEGNDTVLSGNGNDCIVDISGSGSFSGGNGNDIIITGEGNNTIDGGNGRDRIFAGGGNDRVTGGNDNDDLHGEAGNDMLDGDLGNDTVLGGIGNDQLIGGLGNDNLNGEDGTDTANGNLGRDTCTAETESACEV